MAQTDQALAQERHAAVSFTEPDSNGEVIAFIGRGVEFKGTIVYHGTIRIDGVMEGEVQAEGCLLVGDGAVLRAKVTAGVVIAKGTISGDIVAREKVQLLAPAALSGSVVTPLLSIEEGVMFNGKVEMASTESEGVAYLQDHAPAGTRRPPVETAYAASQGRWTSASTRGQLQGGASEESQQ